MAVPERSPRTLRPLSVAALLLLPLLAAACAGPPPPEPLPPQAATRHRPEPTPPPPSPVPAPPPPATTIVIEPAEATADAAAAPSLVEAARREKERRAAAEAPRVALDDKSLAAYAAGQKLTVAEPAPVEEPPAAAEAPAAPAQDETYWRERARVLRERWRQAVEDVERLESESAELRRQFYAEDDAYARDLQIKPEWDRVLGELDRARRDAAAAPRQIEAFLDEGRRAGALPGWLREGIELEPEVGEPAARPAPGAAEPREPTVVERDPDDAS